MNGATYNQLVIFHSIVHEGSIRSAARKLEMAPPSVSQALKALEQNLGLPLFNRTTRRMDLTDAGQLLCEQTLEAISTLNYSLESVRDLSEVPSGKLRITLPTFVYQFFLRPIYQEFCQRYPDIELEISISDAVINIIAESYDMGIRFGGKIEEGMVAKQLTPSMYDALFASDSYLKTHGIPEQPEDLKYHRTIKYRFITSNQIAPLELNFNQQIITVDTPTGMIVNSTDLMMDAALKGIGIGKLVTPLVNKYFENHRLSPVLKECWSIYPGLYLYYPQHSQKARRVRVLIDFLLEKAEMLDKKLFC